GEALDLGTQFGLCAIDLAKQDYDFKITSLQDSVKSLDISKKLAEEDMVEGKIIWAMGKPESLPFEDNTFDLVISGFDMHHWENPVKAFNEIERVMKTKGVMVIGDLRRDAFNVMVPLLKTISYAVKKDKIYEEMKSSFSSSYTKNEVIELLRNSELKGYEVSKDVQFIYIKKEKVLEEKKHVVVKFASA
ncbi:MAG: class I SAM-dependent methyltransferase, partial [Candidatus Aenigmarchaeota archaeon]